VVGERQRSQPEAGCPALGPGHEQLERPAGELHAGDLEEVTRLFVGEAQIGRAQLLKLTLQPEAVKGEARIVPRRQHEPQLRWRLGHERLEVLEALRIVQLMEVVEDDPQRLVETAEVLEEVLDEAARVELATRGDCSDDARSRARGAQGVDQGEPEALRVALSPAYGHPRNPLVDLGLRHPGSEQRRLAAARWSGDEGDARACRERVEQRWALNDRGTVVRAGSPDGCALVCHAVDIFPSSITRI
jgi:hypothetical protein